MRPETKQAQKMVRIRSGNVRTNCGSVSPPVPTAPASASGKTTFFERMRVTYGNESNLSPQELELKISQLWDALSDSNKEKFIRLGNFKERTPVQKENISFTTIRKVSFTPDPIKQESKKERQKNCKEIAKVLDLGTRNTARTSMAETVKSKMRAYAAEASLAASKRLPTDLSPPSDYTPSSSATNAPQELNFEVTAPELAPKQLSRASPAPIPQKKIEIVAPNQLLVPPSRQAPLLSKAKEPSPAPIPTVRRTLKKSKSIIKQAPVRQMVTKMSHREVCEKYYEILSQSTLNYNPKSSQIHQLADVVEGFFVVREYTYYDLL